jgi:hypothetical protein
MCPLPPPTCKRLADETLCLVEIVGFGQVMATCGPDAKRQHFDSGI